MASVEQRQLLSHIVNVFEELKNQAGFDTSGMYLNQLSVVHAIDNSLKDLERMKHFHFENGKKLDRHKYAGFLSKWIAKCRPIQMQNDPPQNSLTAQKLWANSIFATFVMYSFLNKGSINSAIAQHIKYWHQFRDERGETLSLIAYCCEEMN